MDYTKEIKKNVNFKKVISIVKKESNRNDILNLIDKYTYNEPIEKDLFLDVVDYLEYDSGINDSKTSEDIESLIDDAMFDSDLDTEYTYPKSYWVFTIIDFLNDLIKL